MQEQYFSGSESSYEDEYINEIELNNRSRRNIVPPQLENDPHLNIGLLLSQDNESNLLKGTGFLIGKDLVLTAAHFLTQVNRNKPIRFYPGQINLVKKYEVSDFRYDTFFNHCAFSQYSSKYDYALIKLKKPVPRNQYIEILPNYTYQDEEIGVYGYPGNSVHKGLEGEPVCQQGAFEIGMKKVQNGVMIHHLSTVGGMSGSPVFVKRQNKLVAVAIHKGGLRNRKNHQNEQASNAARVIDSQVLANILKWQKEMTLSAIQLYCNKGLSKIDLSCSKLLLINTILEDSLWDLTTPYANRFLIEGNKATLKAINNHIEWAQITTKHFINQAKSKTFQIKFKIHQISSAICIGFILQTRKNQRDSDRYSPETICCNLSGGNKTLLTSVLDWNGDLPKIDFINVDYPTELIIRIDNSKKMMTWVCQNQQVQTKLSERFNKKEHYYVFASMLPDCSIELCS